MNLELFHFLRPWWLLLIPVLLWFGWRRMKGSVSESGWSKLVAPELQPFVLVAPDNRGSSVSWWQTMLAGCLMILALAGPTWERLPVPVFAEQSALVIALDLSASMNAADLDPSRLARAKFKLADILERRQGGQTALLVYAADAFTVTPLSDDVRTIRSQLGVIDTRLLPAQGSNARRALLAARELLEHAGAKQGQVLLITDEVRDQDLGSALTGLVDAGYSLSILGVGTHEGAPVPVPGGMLKDADGNIVVPRLDDAQLSELAKSGGGRYAHITTDDADLDRLALENSGQEQIQEENLQADQWRDLGPWLLLPALPLFGFIFRRGLLYVLPLFFLSIPQPVDASWWDDLWLNADQQGKVLIDDGKPGEASLRFNDPDWLAASAYKSGDYQTAAQAYGKRAGANARYNQGNALAKLGKLEEAIKSYDDALALDAGLEDAEHNKELLQDLLRQQKEQQQQQAGQQGEQDQQQQQDGEQDQGQQEQKDQQQGAEGSRDQKGQKDQKGEKDQQEGQQQEQGENQQGQTGSAEDGAAKDSQQEPSEQDKQEYARQMAEAVEKAQDQKQGQQVDAVAEADEQPPTEEEMAKEQWLMRIPDDPGALLRKKFEYQYRNRARGDRESQPW